MASMPTARSSSTTFRVISIGTLAHNPLWGERGDVRPAHATTVLIDAGDAKILVDPSLPEQILVPRLAERSGLKPEAITHVFLTNFHPMRRRGLAAFDDAQWYVGELEREMIEERDIRRCGAQLTEVVGRLDDPAAEELEPDAVGERAPEERRVRRRDRADKLHASAAFRRTRVIRERRENREPRARRGLAVGTR
jgi:glyoxylase-like metal-dependent hydrolase (beta-lactamase superfamily II)